MCMNDHEATWGVWKSFKSTLKPLPFTADLSTILPLFCWKSQNCLPFCLRKPQNCQKVRYFIQKVHNFTKKVQYFVELKGPQFCTENHPVKLSGYWPVCRQLQGANFGAMCTIKSPVNRKYVLYELQGWGKRRGT